MYRYYESKAQCTISYNCEYASLTESSKSSLHFCAFWTRDAYFLAIICIGIQNQKLSGQYHVNMLA